MLCLNLPLSYGAAAAMVPHCSYPCQCQCQCQRVPLPQSRKLNAARMATTLCIVWFFLMLLVTMAWSRRAGRVARPRKAQEVQELSQHFHAQLTSIQPLATVTAHVFFQYRNQLCPTILNQVVTDVDRLSAIWPRL